MLSDILFESIMDIEYYQSEMDDIYGSLTPRIDFVKAAMFAVQAELDVPFGYATSSFDIDALTPSQANWVRFFCTAQAERWEKLSVQATTVCGGEIERWTSLLRRLDGLPVG